MWHAAVLGSPIAHSKSPVIHQTAYRHLEIPIAYDRHELTVDEVEAFMADLTQRYGSLDQLAGFSVTMPLKAALVPYMAHISPRVAGLGVLNTVVFDTQGVPTGYNTDVDGISGALQHAGFTIRNGGSMAILGAGGTASAAIAAAADLGLDRAVLYVRNLERAAETLAVGPHFGVTVEAKVLSAFSAEIHQHEAVVATLPAHAADHLVTELPAGALPPLLDVIYDPWPTALAQAWDATGASVVSGLDMLLYQGVEQVKLFIDKLMTPPVDIDWEEVTQHMAAALGIQRL